ncbi:MAG: peptidoglycan-binding protein [Pseudomonadota bacterium]
MATLAPAKAEKLQEMLNNVVSPKPPLKIDGIVGKNTKAAIKMLQAKAGLKQSGEIDSETAAVIARVIKTGKIEKEQPQYFFKVNGKLVGMSKKQYDTAIKQAVKELRRGPLFQMKQAIEIAEMEWSHFDKINKDQWFVSFCIETTRGTSLPKRTGISNAWKAYSQCESVAGSGDLAKFYAIYPKAEKIVNAAVTEMRAYRETMIEGGSNWVTGLTFTKTAAFTFVGVVAAPATGAALGTSAVASAMIGGAAVSATQTAAGEIGNAVAGKANWTPGGAIKTTIIDAGVGAVTGFLSKAGSGGKHILEAAVAKLAPKLAKEAGFKLLSSIAVKKAALFLLTEGAKKTLEGALADLAKAAKGKKSITIDQFLDNLVVNFLKGLGMGPVGKVIEKFAKDAAKHLSAKDKQKIWDVVLGELSKQAKDKTIHISDIDTRARALVDKIISDQIAKQLDNVIAVIYDSWKGPMSAAALEKRLREELLAPSQIKAIIPAAKKEVAKSLGKKK